MPLRSLAEGQDLLCPPVSPVSEGGARYRSGLNRFHWRSLSRWASASMEDGAGGRGSRGVAGGRSRLISEAYDNPSRNASVSCSNISISTSSDRSSCRASAIRASMRALNSNWVIAGCLSRSIVTATTPPHWNRVGTFWAYKGGMPVGPPARPFRLITSAPTGVAVEVICGGRPSPVTLAIWDRQLQAWTRVGDGERRPLHRVTGWRPAGGIR
jgi:hypothetical protein